LSIRHDCYKIDTMERKVHLYSSLRYYTNDKSPVTVKGDTVGECLQDLVRQYPGLKPIIFEKDGKLSPQIWPSINLNSPHKEQLDTPLKDGDELYLILLVAGG